MRAPVLYSERIRPPMWWWLFAAVMIASLWVAFAVATGPWWATAVVLPFALVSAGLLARSSLAISVTAAHVSVGLYRLDFWAVSAAEALDAAATRTALGPEADARAFLVTRAYVRRSVRIKLQDPDDPTPYWLVSSRHPTRFADALERARTASHAEPPAKPPAG